MQASLLVCLLAASVFGGQRRSSAESAPSPAFPLLVDIAKRRGGIGESTSFSFGDGGGNVCCCEWTIDNNEEFPG